MAAEEIDYRANVADRSRRPAPAFALAVAGVSNQTAGALGEQLLGNLTAE